MSRGSDEPPHTGPPVLPLQLSYKYKPGVGAGGVVSSTSSPCPPANCQPATLQAFLASLTLEGDNVPQRKEIIVAGGKFFFFVCVFVSFLFVCFARFIVKHQYCATREKMFIGARRRRWRRFFSLICFAPSAAVYSPELFLLTSHLASFPT